MIQPDALDHFVLLVRDLDGAVAWYRDVLGTEAENFKQDRWALRFGTQKINLQVVGRSDPFSLHATPGGGDFCLLTRTPMAQVQAHLAAKNVPVVLGPVERTGANGPILSVYVRDPDENLVEIANRLY
jgi:catechol 2,3-dioxygenase-like lactoylglutathione lyase family enzyme